MSRRDYPLPPWPGREVRDTVEMAVRKLPYEQRAGTRLLCRQVAHMGYDQGHCDGIGEAWVDATADRQDVADRITALANDVREDLRALITAWGQLLGGPEEASNYTDVGQALDKLRTTLTGLDPT